LLLEILDLFLFIFFIDVLALLLFFILSFILLLFILLLEIGKLGDDIVLFEFFICKYFPFSNNDFIFLCRIILLLL
jgi:hypothetical protein